METPITIDEIKEYEDSLNFTRFDAHGQCAPLKDKVTELCSILEDREDNLAFKKLYKQLGIYFTFYERDKDKAQKYFEIYHSYCSDQGLEKAEVLSLLGCAYAIDPTYISQKIFSDCILHLPDDETDPAVLSTKAFALQFWALMLHRQAKYRAIESPAFQHIKKAIYLQEKMLREFPEIKIGLAESLHIYAVMLNKLGEAGGNAAFINEAHESFQKALQLINDFCLETGSPHYLQAIIQQSHAIVLMNLNQPDNAIIKLKNALNKQKILASPKVDIAKSYHLLGDAHCKIKEYTLAFRYYLKALTYKMQIQYEMTI